MNEAEKAFDILANDDRSISHFSHLDRKLGSSVDDVIKSNLKAMQPGELKTFSFEDGSAGILFLRKFVPGQTDLDASHILLAYEGAASADESVTRSKAEAAALADEVKAKLDAGERFETLARSHSDGPSGKDGGSLGTFGLGTMVPAFERVATSQVEGQISDPVETQFGYHLIRTDRVPTLQPDTASYEVLTI